MLEDALDLAVLALAQAERQPQVVALHPIEIGLDRAVLHPVDGDALAQLVELGLIGVAVGAHPVAAQPAGIGMRDHLGQPAVIRQQQEALGVDVEAAHRDHAGEIVRQRLEHGLAPLRVAGRGDEAARLVEDPEPGALAGGQGLAIHRDDVVLRHVDGGRGENTAIEADAALGDHRLGIAARGDAGAGNRLGDALALMRLRGSLVRLRRCGARRCHGRDDRFAPGRRRGAAAQRRIATLLLRRTRRDGLRRIACARIGVGRGGPGLGGGRLSLVGGGRSGLAPGFGFGAHLGLGLYFRYRLGPGRCLGLGLRLGHRAFRLGLGLRRGLRLRLDRGFGCLGRLGAGLRSGLGRLRLGLAYGLRFRLGLLGRGLLGRSLRGGLGLRRALGLGPGRSLGLGRGLRLSLGCGLGLGRRVGFGARRLG
ncbi:hypothetical protein AEGHOMDF_1993 [Methylobacterium soli]|nr:hypothetical protein AEGHOMDF_1993 [Methylobacterium soli]